MIAMLVWESWLVVWTPLKNISQLGWLFPIYGKIRNVPNHQPGVSIPESSPFCPGHCKFGKLQNRGLCTFPGIIIQNNSGATQFAATNPRWKPKKLWNMIFRPNLGAKKTRILDFRVPRFQPWPDFFKYSSFLDMLWDSRNDAKWHLQWSVYSDLLDAAGKLILVD